MRNSAGVVTESRSAGFLSVLELHHDALRESLSYIRWRVRRRISAENLSGLAF
jgi:hypothetical protein